MANVLHGSCLCGETVFEVRGPVRNGIACHCTQCRKQTGHYLVAGGTDSQNLKMIREPHVRWYRSSSTARRAFCSNCGSTLFWQEDAQPERISIALGTIDGATGLVMEGHIFCADKGDYYAIPAEGYQLAQWE